MRKTYDVPHTYKSNTTEAQENERESRKDKTLKKTVQNAIESITYQTKKFPEDSFRIISENKELALPYLSAAIEKALREKDDLDENYQLHFYALFFMGQFQEKSSFPQIIEMASQPEEILDYLLGDAVTEGLSDILYNTYNGDLALLEKTIQNPDVNDFARSGMLHVLGQLYLDGRLAKEEFQDFIRGIVYEEEEIGEYIYSSLASVICDCHFVDMLPEIRHLYEDGRIDPFMIGQYDDCVDLIFQYQYESDLCTAPINAADKLRHWAMFEENPQRKRDDKSMEKFSQLLRDEHHKQAKNLKIGRNDPCPCGSGKKYKKCCLNKPKSSIDLIESIQDRQKWLANYPAPASERREGRVYLEDFFDAGSIEIDQIVYLALHHRAIPIWNREPDNIAESRTWEYLKEAFAKLKQKAKKEEITALDQYNEKYSIHYQCEEWLNILAELSMKHGDMALYHEVSAYCR